MSVFSYNSVTLPYARIVNFVQEAVYDDVGKTDYCYSKFDITVQSVINPAYASLVFPAFVGKTATAADFMNAIRSMLEQPRKLLVVTFNGVNLIPQPAIGLPGTVDARNGPQPMTCQITELTNATFLITYRIVAHYWENNTINANNPNQLVVPNTGNPTLFNRWTETMDIDNCNYTTRTRTGTVRIRSDNAQGLTADRIRQSMAQIGIPNNFLRQRASYTISPDGLSLQYTVVDKEQYRMPPSPAFEAEGEYTESIGVGGQFRTGEVRVKLMGHRAALVKGGAPVGAGTQDQLIATAIGVGCSKLQTRGSEIVTLPGKDLVGPAGFSVILSASLRIELYNNVVEFRCKAWFAAQVRAATATAAGGNPIAAFSSLMPITPGSLDNSLYQPNFLLFGTAKRLLQAAAYYDPSLKNTSFDSTTGQMTAGLQPGQAGAIKEK